MRRRALLISVALIASLGCTDAWAGRTARPIGGEVTSVAFSGNALIVARKRTDGSLRVERLVPGAPVQTIFGEAAADGDDAFVGVTASDQALGLQVVVDADEDRTPSRVLVGPPTGPLREVASCPDGILGPTVAVSGARIAWTEGGCFEALGAPVSPLSLVTGGPDPATPLRRLPIAGEALPSGIVLKGDTGLMGLLLPTFFSLRGEVRGFGAGGLGPVIASQRPGTISPVGVLPNGDAVLFSDGFDEESDEGGPDTCNQSVFVLAPGNSQRRELPFGDCVDDDGAIYSLAGDRVYLLIDEAQNNDSSPAVVKSIRGDGAGLLDVIRGTYRPPEGFTTDGASRVAWWYRGCTRGSVVVVDDGSGPAGSKRIPSCSLKVLRRSARVRGRQITLPVRCPLGCRGAVSVLDRSRSRLLRSYSFERGTHRLRLHLTPRERRRDRLRLEFDVVSGPARTALIRLR